MDFKILKPKIEKELYGWEITSVGVIDRYTYLVAADWDSSEPYYTYEGKKYKHSTKLLCIELETNTVWSTVALLGVRHASCKGGVVNGNKEALFASYNAKIFHIDYNKDKFNHEYNIPQSGVSDMKLIGNHFYIAYGPNSILRRDTPKKWTLISEKPKEYWEKIGDGGAEALAGFSENEIYFCGEEGTLWYYDGKEWERIKGMPKNMNFRYLECSNDGKVYAIDSHLEGVAVGRHNKFEFIAMPEKWPSGDIIYDATTFNGKIYAVRGGLYEFKDDHWDEVKDIPEMYGARSIASNDNVLLVSTPYTIKIYNGKETVTLYGEEKEEAKFITNAFFKHTADLLEKGNELLDELDKQRKD